MKSIACALLAGYLVWLQPASASSYKYQRLQEEIEPYLATKRPYPVPTDVQLPSAPKGCQLVHINHLGRHGSRQVTSMKSFLDDFIKPALKLGIISDSEPQKYAATGNSQLTPLGAQLADRLSILGNGYQNGLYVPATLTQQGIQELEDIGRRLFLNTGLSPREVSNQISLRSLYARSTSKIRTQESRKAFLNGLAAYLERSPESLETTLVTPTDQEIDRILHFYDHCKNYLDSKPIFKKAYKKYVSRFEGDEQYQKAANKLASSFMTGLNDQQSIKLSDLVYSLCQVDANMSYALGICPLLLQTNTSFTSFLKAKSNTANIKQFYKRGLLPELNGLNRDMAIDLMNDFLNSSQSAIDNPNAYPLARLRFAHDSTLLRMLAILDIVTLNNSVDAFGDVTWDIGKLAPMATNIVWQTYQCPAPFNKDESVYMVRMLHNERVENFPIGQCKEGDGFCRWDNVKEYYQERTKNLVLEDICGELIIQKGSDD